MKKFITPIIAAMLILVCFTACKPKIQGGAVIQNAANENFAIVTTPEGGITRDEAGNMIVLVTDQNGKNVKGDDGEYETKAVAIEHALVVGDVIECADFALTVPKGWSNEKSFTEIMIRKDGTEDLITVNNDREGSKADVLEKVTASIEDMKTLVPSTAVTNTTVDILGKKANFISGYVPDDGNGNEAYIAFIVFENENSVYTCNLISNHNMGENLDEYLEILNTVQFR